MTYFFESKFGTAAAIQIQNAMRQAQTIGTSYNRMQKALISQGMGYNRQQMQYDYRKFQAVDRSKTPQAYERAERWFEKIYEPLRKRLGTKEARQFLKELQEGSIETLERAEEAGVYAESYEEAGF